MTANPFAALLDGVPRYTFLSDDGHLEYFLPHDEVLAALAAAVPADLAEAEKVLAKLQSQIGDDVQDVYLPEALHKLSADTIRSLIALATAQAARIEAEKEENRWAYIQAAMDDRQTDAEAERNNLSDKLELERALTDGAHRRAEAAETALAASEARVAKLVDTLALIESVTVHSGGEIHGATIDHYRTAFETVQQEARIALDEIGYGFAITEAGHD